MVLKVSVCWVKTDVMAGFHQNSASRNNPSRTLTSTQNNSSCCRRSVTACLWIVSQSLNDIPFFLHVFFSLFWPCYINRSSRRESEIAGFACMPLQITPVVTSQQESILITLLKLCFIIGYTEVVAFFFIATFSVLLGYRETGVSLYRPDRTYLAYKSRRSFSIIWQWMFFHLVLDGMILCLILHFSILCSHTPTHWIPGVALVDKGLVPWLWCGGWCAHLYICCFSKSKVPLLGAYTFTFTFFSHLNVLFIAQQWLWFDIQCTREAVDNKKAPVLEGVFGDVWVTGR